MNEWVPVKTLKRGDLFEAQAPFGKGFRFGEVRYQGDNGCTYCWPLGHGGEWALDDIALVSVIDLPFLLAVASDRLQENEAYQRGKRDGEAAGKALSSLLRAAYRQLVWHNEEYRHVSPPVLLEQIKNALYQEAMPL